MCPLPPPIQEQETLDALKTLQAPDAPRVFQDDYQPDDLGFTCDAEVVDEFSARYEDDCF